MHTRYSLKSHCGITCVSKHSKCYAEPPTTAQTLFTENPIRNHMQQTQITT
eukprot:m.1645331 g.1645331  ORF g.1645331 m.1645331 type:complete len:51 (+) comp66764_c0_seq1:3-155(+)